LNVCLKNAASVGSALSARGVRPPMEIKLSDALAYLAGTTKEFDLVFADPPYDKDLSAKLLSLVEPVLRPKGRFVLELSSKSDSPQPEGTLELESEKTYGDTKVLIFRRSEQ
ncbi:MAG: RsmD family RNA methyltransferase, partial [Aquiluna sp.]